MESTTSIVWFTLQMALIATALNAPLALGLALFTERVRSARLRALIEAGATLPLVLPPTAVGFLLLELLSRRGPVGAWLEGRGIQILFTPAAVVLATAVMSFPLMFRAFRTAIAGTDPRYYRIARTLGATPLRAVLRVTLPLAWPGLAAGLLLAYCRAIGEFGATILIAGNIPGRTQTLALAIFQRVQNGEDRAAVPLIVFAIALAVGAILVSELLLDRLQRRRA